MFREFLILTMCIAHERVYGYCTIGGSNPYWEGPPIVEQVSITSVNVSWSGNLKNVHCADSILVKHWTINNPIDFKLSTYLPTTQFSFIVTDLVPKQLYEFQVIAREDKGILGVDYNKSEKTRFKTVNTNSSVCTENPGFDGPPIVEQVSPTSVQVSWLNKVTIPVCIQFHCQALERK